MDRSWVFHAMPVRYSSLTLLPAHGRHSEILAMKNGNGLQPYLWQMGVFLESHATRAVCFSSILSNAASKPLGTWVKVSDKWWAAVTFNGMVVGVPSCSRSVLLVDPIARATRTFG